MHARGINTATPGGVPSATFDTTGSAPVYAETTTDGAGATQRQLLDNTAWLSDFKRAYTFIPNSLLPEKEYQAFYTRVYRVVGEKILPMKQGLLDVQANVLSTHCPLLGYSCRGYLMSGSASITHTSQELLQLKSKAPAELCRTVCMVQIFPLSMKEAISDCPACLSLQPDAAFQQYDIVHALLEVSIDRNSLIPLVMRLRWFPTTSGPQFANAGLQRELPQLEQHIIHNPHLAQHVPQWMPYTAVSLIIQMYGPDVAPLTIGKQNLVMYVLRQLEKHFFVVNQFFRLQDCSHNVDQQSASVSLTIVTHTGITDVGLDTVIVSYSEHFTNSLQQAGLNVTRLTITGPLPCPNETVADQVVHQLGLPSMWQQLRFMAVPTVMTGLAILLAITALYHGAGAVQRLPHLLSSVLGVRRVAPEQNMEMDYSYAGRYARRLHVDLLTGPQAERADLEICKLADGSPWVLGSGACGVVYKAVRDGVQDVAVKVLAASPSEAIQLHALKKEICLLRMLSFDPNVVQFYGACLDPGFPMLVLEYMQGGDLLSCIQHDCYPTAVGKFKWYKKGRRIALDVAKGMVFMHEQKVVHNDIKSKNILLTKDAAVAKISDVGTSRILETTAATLSFPMLCTYAYAAPEQLMGTRDVCTDKVDMFSFGVVLWEIITQETPRRGFLRKTSVPNECPQIIEELITSCLSAVPSNRPSAKQACKIIASTLHLPDPAVGLGASRAKAI
ncbi:hypothetical protein WJX79_002702 [Trebouxia sp. C0005]